LSNKTKKKGFQTGRQRYVCLTCKKNFRSQYNKNRLQKSIWSSFVYGRQTIGRLSKEYTRSPNWVRKQLNDYRVPQKAVVPCKTVIIADSTFFKHWYGICVLRANKLNKNIYWRQIDYERVNDYDRARIDIERRGFVISAVVTDGKPGVRGVFGDVPVQMCHFHQKQIIIRHLTTRPKLEAGIELRKSSQTLCESNEKEFTQKLDAWHLKWHDFLKEKTIDPETGKVYYTHRRIRSAHYSLRTNLPYLFTYLKYPKRNIPNTTNSLEGCFSHLKELTKIHRGLNYQLKRKMIDEILAK